MGVKLLEQEIKLQREEYKQKLQSDLDKVPFDNVRTRAYKKKIKADMKPGRSVSMGARTKRSAQEDRDVADLSISQAIDEVNRLSISLEMAERMGLTRSVPEIHTELGILERLLDALGGLAVPFGQLLEASWRQLGAPLGPQGP